MTVSTKDIIENLETADKEKVVYFVNLLLEQKKYQSLKKELNERREQIKQGDSLSHNDFWKDVNV